MLINRQALGQAVGRGTQRRRLTGWHSCSGPGVGVEVTLMREEQLQPPGGSLDGGSRQPHRGTLGRLTGCGGMVSTRALG